MCKSVLLIFYDSVNRASQKQEFPSQRIRETKTDTKQLALARLNDFKIQYKFPHQILNYPVSFHLFKK